MTVEAEKFAKESRAPWIFMIIAAYAGMAVTGGLAVATVCLAAVVAVAGLIYALGELMGKDGYDLPESRKKRLATKQDDAASVARPSPMNDLHAADRAA
jgi:hypothetical protein